MKIQLEQIDLLHAWPTLELRRGFQAMRILVRIGNDPIGEVYARPTRRRRLEGRHLARVMRRKLCPHIFKALARAGAAPADPGTGDPRDEFKTARRSVAARMLFSQIVLPTGLAEPWRSMVVESTRHTDWALPPVTVVICTRNRSADLATCLNSLSALDYPDFEVLLVDNSDDPVESDRVRKLAELHKARYLRAPEPGLSRARNLALRTSRTRWVAFTDDDCRPEPLWLQQLVRPLQDRNCRCVTGLVLAARLDNSAEITFEIYGGLGRGFAPRVYDWGFLTRERTRCARTWDIGAGASMLIDAHLALKLGGFDVDLGAGAAAPCSEDTDLFYRLLRCGRSIHYEPRAIVHHHHRATEEALERQIYNYASGHAAYHLRCLVAYRDYRSLLHLLWHLPRWFLKNARRGRRGRTRYPFWLVGVEARGTLAGLVSYPAAKLRSLLNQRKDEPPDTVATDRRGDCDVEPEIIAQEQVPVEVNRKKSLNVA